MDRVEKILWIITILIPVLLILVLSSCKTHKERTVDYEITSSEAYQERRLKEHENQMAIRMAESHDTVRETATRSGQIEIERDTAGRAVKIIYEHIFNDIRTQGFSQTDTVYQKQVIVLRDSVGSGQKDSIIEGQTKEKKDIGINSLGTLVFCGFWLLIGGVASLLFILAKRNTKWKR